MRILDKKRNDALNKSHFCEKQLVVWIILDTVFIKVVKKEETTVKLDFAYENPTKIYFGHNALSLLRAELA